MSQSNITRFFKAPKRKIDNTEPTEEISRTISSGESNQKTNRPNTEQIGDIQVSQELQLNSNCATTASTSSAGSTHKVHSVLLKKQKLSTKFYKKWADGRPWLKYVFNEGMYCVLCQKYNKLPFGRTKWNTSPSVRLRLQSIKDHENTCEHKDSIRAELMNTKCRKVPEILSAPETVSEDGMVKAFKCLYWLCKQKIAHTTKFEQLLDLETALGVDIKQQICKGKNAKYTSRTAIGEFLECINQVIEEDILTDMKASEQFALMFDETTDCAVIEQMIIHCRYINAAGEVCVKYCKILDALSNNGNAAQEGGGAGDMISVISLNADQIAGKVTDFIEKNDLKYEYFCGIGTDGAAVMTGKTNGAVRKIVDRQIEKETDRLDPNKLINKAVGKHCAAHKLNLAAKQAGNEFPVIKRFKTVTASLYAFYSRSAVRSAGLLAIQNLLKATLETEESGSTSGKVLSPSETRWLALGECAVKLKNILPSVIVSLEREAEERGDNSAAGLVNLMTRFAFIATLFLLCEILPTINRLSLQFQKSHIDFTAINTSLTATIAILKRKKELDLTANITCLQERLDSLDISMKLKAQNIEEECRNYRDSTQIPFIDKLIENIEARFQDKHIMQAFTKVMSPKSYSTNELNEEELFPCLETLCQQFAIPKDRAVNELKDFITYVQVAGDDKISESEFLKKLTATGSTTKSTIYTDTFPSITKVAKIYKVIPPHTADCERDFSHMKLIKSDARNRMGENTLDSLLRITLEGPPLEEFPYRRAVKLWAEKKERRYKVKVNLL